MTLVAAIMIFPVVSKSCVTAQGEHVRVAAVYIVASYHQRDKMANFVFTLSVKGRSTLDFSYYFTS